MEKLKIRVNEIVEFVRYMDRKVGEMSHISMKRGNNSFKRNDRKRRNHTHKKSKSDPSYAIPPRFRVYRLLRSERN